MIGIYQRYQGAPSIIEQKECIEDQRHQPGWQICSIRGKYRLRRQKNCQRHQQIKQHHFDGKYDDPVSYTHLDVYKRQGMVHALHRQQIL